METKPLDFVLSFSFIAFLLLSAGFTAVFFSFDNRYHLIFDTLLFLFCFGVYSVVTLKIARYFKPYPQGSFDMDSKEFMYWKLCAVIVDLASKAFNVYNTVFTQPLIISALGAQVGKNSAIAGTVRDHPLITISDYATIGQNSVITAHVIVHNQIILKPIVIGKNSVVGINCVVMPGVVLGEGAVIAPGSVVKIDTHIPAYEFWGGIPAQKLKDLVRPD